MDGQGAYVPTVKLVRQTRRHHLADRKPRGLYFELETYWAFEGGVTGTTFAEIFASTLERIATRLETGVVINDPALAREYNPAPESADLEHAAAIFRDVATKAALALAADRCEAARLWREILARTIGTRSSRSPPVATSSARRRPRSRRSLTAAPARLGPLPDIQTVDHASLDRFIADLVTAGFKPFGTDGRTFEGALHPALAAETRSTTMRIEVRDGWPFVHPAVRVEGLKPSVHLTGCHLCLWRLGDDSYGWLRLETLNERIGQWAERYRGRATEEDPVLDPQLYWSPFNGEVLATVDLHDVPYGNGGSGDLRAERDELLLKIGAAGPLRVRWYGRDEMRHPPANLEMIEAGLKPDQAANFRDELERVGHADGPNIIMVVWDTPAGEPNALVLGLSRGPRRAPVRAEAYEVARVDHGVFDPPGRSRRAIAARQVGRHLRPRRHRLAPVGVAREQRARSAAPGRWREAAARRCCKARWPPRRRWRPQGRHDGFRCPPACPMGDGRLVARDVVTRRDPAAA